MTKLERISSTELPNDYYNSMDYLWIKKNNQVYKRKRTNHQIHEEIWGPDVWANEERGYYNSNYEIVTCHTSVDLDLERKLLKKFPTALKLRACG